jgi:hypothetical protein
LPKLFRRRNSRPSPRRRRLLLRLRRPRPITVAVSSVGASSRVVRRRVPAWRVPKVDPRLRRRRPDPMGAR